MTSLLNYAFLHTMSRVRADLINYLLFLSKQDYYSFMFDMKKTPKLMIDFTYEQKKQQQKTRQNNAKERTEFYLDVNSSTIRFTLKRETFSDATSQSLR